MQSSSARLLAQGISYYNNDDLSGRAEKIFKSLTTDKSFGGTREAGTAQYYLGSYYHRLRYIYQDKAVRTDKATTEKLLRQSRDAYDGYIQKAARLDGYRWLAESYFDRALVSLELGNISEAASGLGAMRSAASRDRSAFVYQIVYSRSTGDVIDYSFDTVRLADLALDVLSRYRPGGFEQFVAELKQRCQSAKSMSKSPIKY